MKSAVGLEGFALRWRQWGGGPGFHNVIPRE
jgi:hypothetical protein